MKNLELIGKGIHGRVYKIDRNRCIKIFKENKFYKKELETLLMAQKNRHFPKIFEWGENYIVREYVEGIELDKYLKKNPMTRELAEKIVVLYEAMGEVGFTRCDAILFHIFVMEDGALKIIDTARVMRETTDYPKLIISGLKELGCKEQFLNYVKELRPALYELWIKEK